MIKTLLKITENRIIAPDVYEMSLTGAPMPERPGQFLDISVPGFFLRRPLSIADHTDGITKIVYKTVGKGTDAMADLTVGTELEALFPLGNGYDVSDARGDTFIVGGGLGIPPLYFLAKQLIGAGIRPDVILGFNSEADIFYENDFRRLGLSVTVTTADGSRGVKGFVTDAMPENADYVFACGPEPMLKAVYERSRDGQFSFEARMGCGFGACMGCSRMMKSGPKRICKEGPVFPREEIIW